MPGAVDRKNHPFCFKGGTDISAGGILRQLYESGLVKDVEFILLEQEELLKLERMVKSRQATSDKPCIGQKSPQRWWLPVIRFGKERFAFWQPISKLTKLAAATTEEIIGLDEIGPKIASSVENFSNRKKPVLDKLEKAGVNFYEEPERGEETAL